MKVLYKFDYSFGDAEVAFEVDLKVFTKEIAQELLDFFTWSYDKHGNPIDEIMVKIAMEAIREGGDGVYNTFGVRNAFNNKEGFIKIDGSQGVLLSSFSAHELEEERLEFKIIGKNN